MAADARLHTGLPVQGKPHRERKTIVKEQRKERYDSSARIAHATAGAPSEPAANYIPLKRKLGAPYFLIPQTSGAPSQTIASCIYPRYAKWGQPISPFPRPNNMKCPHCPEILDTQYPEKISWPRLKREAVVYI
jgi:hypothetical protein